VSDEAVAKLNTLGPRLNAEDRQEPDMWDDEEHRYIAVSE
jgi:hypothetical protein